MIAHAFRLFTFLSVLGSLLLPAVGPRAEEDGLRGEPEAIQDAEAMVEAMGGREVWAEMETIHFVHEWFPYNRVDSYIENEILDLNGPRSWVTMESEGFYRIRAYSPEYGYWSALNGEFSVGSQEALANAMGRAPFSIYRIARGIARSDSFFEVRYGEGDIQGSRRLEFYGPDGELGGWIILNAKKEPIVWATLQYRYTFGPMKQFGNIRLPDWAVYGNGLIFYQMITVTTDGEAPDLSLFTVPEEFRK